jgi:DNA ligase 1
VALLAGLLRGLGPEDLPAAVALLSGESRRMRVGVGYAALRELPPPAARAELGIAESEQALCTLAAVQGTGSQAERHRQLVALFSRATAEEQDFLRADAVRGSSAICTWGRAGTARRGWGSG